MASIVLLLFAGELLFSLPLWNFAAAQDDGPAVVTDGLCVRDPTNNTYWFHWGNASYLMLTIKGGTGGMDFLNFSCDGRPLVATYGGVNAWALDLPEEDWGEHPDDRVLHNVTFNPGDLPYIDSIWVQPVILASGNVTVAPGEEVAIPFFGGGDAAILLRPNGSYLDLGVRVDDVTLKERLGYLRNLGYPDADCATVAGGIEGREANRFDLDLGQPGNHTLYLAGNGSIPYVITDSNLDWDGDLQLDSEEVEKSGTSGYHPLISSAWGYFQAQEQHPTLWDDLDAANFTTLVDLEDTTYFTETFAFYVPSDWALPNTRACNLYMDCLKGVVTNITLDGQPVLWNETLLGFDFLADEGTSLTWELPETGPQEISLDGCWSSGIKFLGIVGADWHRVDYWASAAADAVLGTDVTFRINDYTIPTRDAPERLDTDYDGISDDVEAANAMNPVRYDTDNDHSFDGNDLSPTASLVIAGGEITQLALPGMPGKDIKVTLQLQRPPEDLAANRTLAWCPPGENTPMQVQQVHALRVFGPGDGEESDYWTNRDSFEQFWDNRPMHSYTLADVATIELTGDCSPLPLTTADTAYGYWTLLLPTDETATSWFYEATFPANHPALSAKGGWIDLRFDVVEAIVRQDWANTSDQSLLRVYETPGDAILQGVQVMEIDQVAWALGSPDSACENEIMWATIQNPGLGNPANYGLGDTTAPDVDVAGWQANTVFYPQYGFNPASPLDTQDPATFGAVQQIAAARKVHPRETNEAEVTYYAWNERVFDALGLMNQSIKIDPGTGTAYGPFPGNDHATLSVGDAVNFGANWEDLTDPTTGAGVRVVKNVNAHQNVLAFTPLGSSATAGARKRAATATTSGTAEFWVYLPSDATGTKFSARLQDNQERAGPSLVVTSQDHMLWYEDATGTMHALRELWGGEWFKLIIYFNVSTGTYGVEVGGVSASYHGDLPFSDVTCGEVTLFEFIASGGRTNVDAVQFNWDPDFEDTETSFREMLAGVDTVTRRSFYTISDFYNGTFKAGDTELQGGETTCYSTYRSNILHEDLRVDLLSWPIAIALTRASDDPLDGFSIADVLEVTYGVGDVLATSIPATKTGIQPGIHDPLLFTNTYHVEVTNEALQHDTSKIPPVVVFGPVDVHQRVPDWREREADRVNLLFQRHTFSLWEEYLYRVALIEFYCRGLQDEAIALIDIITRYYSGQVPNQEWVRSYSLSFGRSGLELVPATREWIATNAPSFESPPWCDTSLQNYQTIMDACKRMGDKPYTLFKGKRGQRISLKISHRTITEWLTMYVRAIDSFIDTLKVPVGTPVPQHIIGLAPGGLLAKKKVMLPTTFMTKAGYLKAFRMGKFIRFWGMHCFVRVSVPLEPTWVPGMTEKEKARFDSDWKAYLNAFVDWALYQYYREGRQYRAYDTTRMAEAIDIDFDGAGRFLWIGESESEIGEETIWIGTMKEFTKDTHAKIISFGLKYWLKQAKSKHWKGAAELELHMNNIEILHQKLNRVTKSTQEVLENYCPTEAARHLIFSWWHKDAHIGNEVLVNERVFYVASEFLARLCLTLGNYYQLPAEMGGEDLLVELFRNYQIAGAPAIVLQAMLEKWIAESPAAMDFVKFLDKVFEELQNLPYENLYLQLEQTYQGLKVAFEQLLKLVPKQVAGEDLGEIITITEAKAEWFIQKCEDRGRVTGLTDENTRNLLQAMEEHTKNMEFYLQTGLSKDKLEKEYDLGLSRLGKERVYWNSKTSQIYSISGQKYYYNPLYGILSENEYLDMLESSAIRRRYDKQLYIILNETQFVSTDFMALLVKGRKVLEEPPRILGVQRDLMRQWLVIIAQAEITEDGEIISKLQYLAAHLLTLGLIQEIVALGSVMAMGLLEYFAPTVAQNVNALLQEVGAPMVGAAGGYSAFFDLFQFDWSSSWAMLESMNKILDWINIAAIYAGFFAGGLMGVTEMSLFLSLLQFTIGGILYLVSFLFNQQLPEALSHISAEIGVGVSLPEQTRQNVIKHGGLETCDQLNVSFEVANTGITYLSTISGTNPPTQEWFGNGSDFTYHAQVAATGHGGTPSLWQVYQSIDVKSGWVFMTDGVITQSTSGENKTLPFLITLEESAADFKLAWRDYFTSNQDADTPSELHTLPLGISVTESTLADFLAHCRPTERSMVENKAWDFLVAAWEGRLKDASDAVDQAIAAFGFTPEQFNVTFTGAIPNYKGEGYDYWSEEGIPFCQGCDALFNASLGFCPQCGWILDHYGDNISRYGGPCGWHDLVTRYFAEGVRAVCAAPGGPDLTVTEEWQASLDGYFDSCRMLLVPADWLACKNQSIPLLQALCAARDTITLAANLDVTPSWGGILDLPANGTTQQTIFLAVDGLAAETAPSIIATIIPPAGFTASFVPGQSTQMTIPLEDGRTIDFELKPAAPATLAGFYTMVLNISLANGTHLMAITVPFRYAWDQGTGLEFLALPDTVTPGDAVQWGHVINQGTEPSAFLVGTDGLPADWLQSTGRATLAHVDFDLDTNGFTLADCSSGTPTFAVTQPIQKTTYITYEERNTNFGSAEVLVPGWTDQWAFFGVPALNPNTPFVAPAGTSAWFYMDSVEPDSPSTGTWKVYFAPPFDEDTITLMNAGGSSQWSNQLVYSQPAAFAEDWAEFPDLAPGVEYVLFLWPGLIAFRLRSDDYPDTAARPFSATTYNKVCTTAGTLVIQTDTAEALRVAKPVTWEVQAGDTITVRSSISGPGNVSLTLGEQSFPLVPAGNTQHGLQVKTFTITQDAAITSLEIGATLAAGTLLRVESITIERALTLSEQAASAVTGGFYNETIDLQAAGQYTALASYAFADGTEGWAGTFSSGETAFDVDTTAYLAYVCENLPTTNFHDEEIVLIGGGNIAYAYLPPLPKASPYASFVPEEHGLRVNLIRASAGTINFWYCDAWDGETLTYETSPWGSGIALSYTFPSALSNTLVDIRGLPTGYFMLDPQASLGGSSCKMWGNYKHSPRTIHAFEKFGARDGKLLFQTDVADSFIAQCPTNIALRAGDRIRVTLATSCTQLVTLRAGDTTYTLVPAGNSAVGPQEKIFAVPADCAASNLEIAGDLGAEQYLHVESITIERPAQVLDYVYGHRDVLALGALGGDVTVVEYPINPPVTGSVDMWVAGSNLTVPLSIELAGDNGGARLIFEDQELHAWDGSTIIPLATFSAWTGWTFLSLDFDLLTDTFAVRVNNVTLASNLHLTATGDVTCLQVLRLTTTRGDQTYFVDGVSCTWMDLTYETGDNLWPAWAAGSEQFFFIAPGASRNLEIVVPRHYSIAPGPRRFVAKVVNPITRRLLGVYAATVNVGEFYDLNLEVIPVHAAGMPGTQGTYTVQVTNLGNVQQAIVLTCEGSTITGGTFATPTYTLGPGQSFSTSLTVDPAMFESGIHAFAILATSATNQTSTGASYLVNDVPILSAPPDCSYESGTAGHSIQWEISDTYFNASETTWNVSRAILGTPGELVASGTWDDARSIAIPVDGLGAGTYLYHVQTCDGFGGEAQDKVILVVTQDGVAYLPQVNSTDAIVGENQTYATPLGNGTLAVTFNATEDVTLVVGAWDANPTAQDPGFAGEGLYFAVTVSDEAAVDFPVYVTVPLPAGIPPNATEAEIAEMVVPFTFDELTSTWVMEEFPVSVALLAGTATVAITHLSQFALGVLNFPSTITNPPDVCFEVGTPGQVITWTITDETTTRPTYGIAVDGSLVATGSWQSGVPVTLPISDLTTGDHVVTITALDGRGSTVTDEVTASVSPDDDTTVEIANVSCNMTSGNVTLTFEDVDISGITRVDWVAVNGTRVQHFTTSTNGTRWTVTWANNCTRGNYTVTFGITDGDNERPGDVATAAFSCLLEIPWTSVAEGLLRGALAECLLLREDIAEVNCCIWRLTLQILAGQAEFNLQQALDLVLANCTDCAAIRVWVVCCQVSVADMVTWVGDYVECIDATIAARLHGHLASISTSCCALLEVLAEN